MHLFSFPKTTSGKWAVGFGIALVVTALLSVIFAAAIGGDAAVVEGSRLLSTLAAALSIVFTLTGPVSFLFGLYTVIRHREWSTVSFLAGLYALTLLLFLVGEFAFQH